VHLGPVDVAALVDEVTSTLSPAVQANGNRLTVTCAHEGLIQSDEVLVKQCLLNLLSNANKFTRNGDIRLRVRQTGPLLAFEVADTGIGMSAQQIANLFQPFVQGDASMTRKYGGTGLGLAITRRLARLMSGDVTVTSTPGAGSVFTLTISTGAEASAKMAQAA